MQSLFCHSWGWLTTVSLDDWLWAVKEELNYKRHSLRVRDKKNGIYFLGYRKVNTSYVSIYSHNCLYHKLGGYEGYLWLI